MRKPEKRAQRIDHDLGICHASDEIYGNVIAKLSGARIFRLGLHFREKRDDFGYRFLPQGKTLNEAPAIYASLTVCARFHTEKCVI